MKNPCGSDGSHYHRFVGAEANHRGMATHARFLRNDGGSLMLVGHNPMIEDVACALAGAGDPAALRRLQGGVPVAALAVIAFDGDFAAAKPSSGRLLAFLTPGD